MNLWEPKSIKELKEDAKFSADFLINEPAEAFKDLESINQFVENWESWLFTFCYFEDDKKSWFIEVENKKINVSNLYKITFLVYESAKEFLKSLNLYTPYYYGFAKMTAHYYNRERE